MQIGLVSVYENSLFGPRCLCAKWHVPTTICSGGAVREPTTILD